MSLENEINDRFVVDSESILQDNLDRTEGLFSLYEDGTINISDEVREVSPEIQLLTYFIAQRFLMEGGMSEEDKLGTDYFYERINRSDRTVREYLQQLREAGLITKESQSEHRLIVENLPNTLNRIERSIERTEGDS